MSNENVLMFGPDAVRADFKEYADINGNIVRSTNITEFALIDADNKVVDIITLPKDHQNFNEWVEKINGENITAMNISDYPEARRHSVWNGTNFGQDPEDGKEIPKMRGALLSENKIFMVLNFGDMTVYNIRKAAGYQNFKALIPIEKDTLAPLGYTWDGNNFIL